MRFHLDGRQAADIAFTWSRARRTSSTEMPRRCAAVALGAQRRRHVAWSQLAASTLSAGTSHAHSWEAKLARGARSGEEGVEEPRG